MRKIEKENACARRRIQTKRQQKTSNTSLSNFLLRQDHRNCDRNGEILPRAPELYSKWRDTSSMPTACRSPNHHAARPHTIRAYSSRRASLLNSLNVRDSDQLERGPCPASFAATTANRSVSGCCSPDVNCCTNCLIEQIHHVFSPTGTMQLSNSVSISTK